MGTERKALDEEGEKMRKKGGVRKEMERSAAISRHTLHLEISPKRT